MEIKVTKVDENWYRAEKTIENGLLTFIEKAYGTTEEQAKQKIYDNNY